MVKFASKTVKHTILAICLAVVPSVWVLAGSANKPIATDSSGLAIKGYDTVAYFTEGRAIKGKKEFVSSWHEARWRFATAAHRDLFAANPERYAPKFGGFCAMGIAFGMMAVADPEAWTIVDGKLYIKRTKATRERWLPNKAENIIKAEENWAKQETLKRVDPR